MPLDARAGSAVAFVRCLDEAPVAFPQVFGAPGTAQWSSGPFRGPPEVIGGFRVPSNPPALCFRTSLRSYPPAPIFN
eukprot:6173350-Pyramimonas_sp.AAC.1